MRFRSAIYAGIVLHSRSRPKLHNLRYRVFSLLIDLDELEQLDRGLHLFGYNRAAVYSLHDSDHGEGQRGGLRSWVENHLKAADIDPDGMRIGMLCYPRIFGYVFNPLTVYFCHNAEGEMRAVLYEVSNTFGERHTYVIAVEGDAPVLQHGCAKQMYVSPFMPMNCHYQFRTIAPKDSVGVHISESDDDGPLLFASFSGKRVLMSDINLLRMLLSYPLMTVKVMVGIHFEALRLWLKKIPVHRHVPATKPIASTIVLHNGIKKS